MKYKLFILTVLSTVGFYNYHDLINDQVSKALFYLNMMMCLIVAMRDGISLKGVKYPRYSYIVLLAGLLLSGVMATAFHSQSLVVSYITLMPYFLSYLFFFILMKFDIPQEKIMKAFMWFCGIATVVYICNMLTLPHNMFGKPILGEDLTRGIIRFPIPFIVAFPMIVFYSINKFLDTKERKWLVYMSVASLIIFLSAIRQLIGLTAVLGLAFMFREIILWKKVALAVSIVLVVIFVLPQIPIYKSMIEVTEDQRDENDQKENIRITSWKYFTYENQTNEVTPFFGNGMPSYNGSIWGRMFDTETDTLGCFPADVGWAGFYWHFGLFATAALLYMMIKGILKKKRQDQQYLTYYLLYLLITSVASGPILYYNEVMYVCVCLYLIFKPTETEAVADKTEQEGTSDSATDVSMAQLPKYPQLP